MPAQSLPGNLTEQQQQELWQQVSIWLPIDINLCILWVILNNSKFIKI